MDPPAGGFWVLSLGEELHGDSDKVGRYTDACLGPGQISICTSGFVLCYGEDKFEVPGAKRRRTEDL